MPATGGRDGAIRLERAAIATLDEVERVCREEGIDADLVRGGTLHVAQHPAQLERLRAEVRHEHEWGGLTDDDLRLLGPDELAPRLRVAGALGASFTPHCARIHPAKLVRGLAAAVERRGTAIYEGTRALAIGNRQVATAQGRVRAEWVVCATEGYTARLPGLRRALHPARKLDDRDRAAARAHVAGARLGRARDAARRRARVQLRAAHRRRPHRHRRAGRARIASARASTGTPSARARPPSQLRRALIALFPSLADVRIDHRWAGVLGLARDWCASVTADRATGNAWAGGYVGNGVSTANLAARTLADLILERESELVTLPWVGHRSRRFEPEPLRFLGARSLYLAYRAADRAEASGGRASRLASAASVDRRSLSASGRDDPQHRVFARIGGDAVVASVHGAFV